MSIVTRPVTLEKENNLRQIAELHLKGFPAATIAKKIGVKVNKVYVGIRELKELWKNEYVDKYENIVVTQLQKLDLMENEAWEAWEKSKAPLTITTTKRGLDRGPTRSTSEANGEELENTDFTEEKSTKREGDPKFLKVIQWCFVERSKITGVYASHKLAERRQVMKESWFKEAVDLLRKGSLSEEEAFVIFPEQAQLMLEEANVAK